MQMQNKGACCWCQGSGGSNELSTRCAPPYASLLYADMLKQCFGIEVNYARARAICAACADRLRDAWQFRCSVLRAERDLACCGGGECEVKAEWVTADDKQDGGVSPSRSDSDRDYPDAQKHGVGKSQTHPKQIALTKSEFCDEGAAKCLAKNRVTITNDRSREHEALKEKRDSRKAADLKMKKTQIASINFTKPTMKTIGVQKKRATKIFTPISFKAIKIKPRTYNLQPIRTCIDSEKNEPGFMTESNAALIIESSYVCPFKCKYNEYLCFYCGGSFREPEQLREHTRKDHSTSGLRRLLRCNQLTKIDVTIVNCKLCAEPISDLDTLKEHLTKEHKKKFYAEVGDGVLPFILSKDVLKCALCEARFPYFHAVSQHINEHFPNYVCETCGLGFADQARLQVHKSKHERRACPCETCGRSFSGSYALKEHIDRVHKRRGRIYCPVCPERFLSQEKKTLHLISAHGKQPEVFKCADCSKDFQSRRTYTLHKRKVHLRDFHHECAYCNRKFFTKTGLRNHTPTHTGERNYRCDACGKSFPRKKALTEHVRAHGEQGRFVCAVCGHLCGQSQDLRVHFKTLHPDCELDKGN